jgi:hypothetical protein
MKPLESGGLSPCSDLVYHKQAVFIKRFLERCCHYIFDIVIQHGGARQKEAR